MQHLRESEGLSWTQNVSNMGRQERYQLDKNTATAYKIKNECMGSSPVPPPSNQATSLHFYTSVLSRRKCVK